MEPLFAVTSLAVLALKSHRVRVNGTSLWLSQVEGDGETCRSGFRLNLFLAERGAHALWVLYHYFRYHISRQYRSCRIFFIR